MFKAKLFAVCALLCVAAGCTLSEWGQVATDAYTEAIEPGGTIDQIIENPSPIGAIVAIAGLVSLLFVKSARRGFGKAIVMAATTPVKGASWVLTLVKALFIRKAVDVAVTPVETPKEEPKQ